MRRSPEFQCQRARVVLERGARRATPDVRAQRHLFDLGQLPVEGERDPQTRTLTLRMLDGSHVD
jgi:hypothetical protein